MKWSVVLAILGAVVLGAVDESYQRLTGRNADIHDWAADCLGAAVSQCCLVLRARIRNTLR